MKITNTIVDTNGEEYSTFYYQVKGKAKPIVLPCEKNEAGKIIPKKGVFNLIMNVLYRDEECKDKVEERSMMTSFE